MRTTGDGAGKAIACRDGKLGEGSLWGHLANAVALPFGKPEVAIGTAGDLVGKVVLPGKGELGEDAFGRDAPKAIGQVLGKPEIAVRTIGDSDGKAPLRGEEELGSQRGIRHLEGVIKPSSHQSSADIDRLSW